MVILDFGGLNLDGTQHKLFNGVWYPKNTIINLAESFINGYTSCNPGNGSSILVVATNNSLYFNATNGAAFTNTVKSVSSYASTVTTKVMVWGGADIETRRSLMKSIIGGLVRLAMLTVLTLGVVLTWPRPASRSGAPLGAAVPPPPH